MLTRSLAVLVVSLVAGCGSSPPPAAAAPPAPQGPDVHGIDAEEVLVSSAVVPDNWTSGVEGWVAKLQKPADEKGEATFYVVRNNGSEMRSKTWFRSHPAAKEELKPGALVACFEDNRKESVALAPATPAASRNGRWLFAHVADVAELEKGHLRIGGLTCDIAAVRVLVPNK